MTCRQVSDALGCSENTVRSWVHRGVIKSGQRTQRRHRNGGLYWVDVFDPREINRLDAQRRKGAAPPPSDPGEVAAQAFELFELGTPLRQVVVRLRQQPARISELHEQWMDLGGADVVITAEAKEALAKIVGPFDDVADLVKLVATRLSAVDLASNQAPTG